MRIIDQLSRKEVFSALSLCPSSQGWKCWPMQPWACEFGHCRAQLWGTESDSPSRQSPTLLQTERMACLQTLGGSGGQVVTRESSLLLCTKFRKHHFALHILEGCLCTDFPFSGLWTILSAWYENPLIRMSDFYHLSLHSNDSGGGGTYHVQGICSVLFNIIHVQPWLEVWLAPFHRWEKWEIEIYLNLDPSTQSVVFFFKQS